MNLSQLVICLSENFFSKWLSIVSANVAVVVIVVYVLAGDESLGD